MQTSNQPPAKIWLKSDTSPDVHPTLWAPVFSSILSHLFYHAPLHMHIVVQFGFQLFTCFQPVILSPTDSREISTVPDQERKEKSQEKYLHKPQGRMEGGCWYSWIRRMFYFCRIWAGISNRSGLNASLSYYKDKYIIESGIKTEMCGMRDV